ncbi:MAG: zinc-ribbon domain-containing protein, partial [Sulfurimicrobium sp.]|nr:zinc-ribbon domain-containing protein [Sulfurimicrobium sp.]
MSHITACPECQTRFRVTEEQLQMRNGSVRCGRCSHVFNALATLIDEPPPLAAEPVPASTQQTGAAEREAPLPVQEPPVMHGQEVRQEEAPAPETGDDT